MGKAERNRWTANVKALEIVAKDRREITDGAGEEVEWRRADGTVELRSTYDFGWHDEIVAEWQATKEMIN